jgi:hypothetical protein
MKTMTFWPALVAAAVLTACGGGGGNPPPPAPAAAAAPSYPDTLAQLNTASGLTSSALAAVFDAAYLDSGMTKAQVLDALGQEAAAMGASPEHSLFPQVALSNVSLTGCDSNNVCTLNGTLLNADGDGTSVDFSTRVVNSNGGYRLLGDQQAS